MTLFDILIEKLITDPYYFCYNYLQSVFNSFISGISDIIDVEIYNYFINQNGFFLFFGLFILTNLLSLVFMTYFGLFGIFVLNGLSIVLFWFFLTLEWLNISFDSQNVYLLNLGDWILVSTKNKIEFLLIFDALSINFVFLTTTIAVFVYFFAFSYFKFEPHVDRLLIFLNLFVISMIILVTAGNLVVLFLGWELIGLTSFMLINFWTTKISTLKAAFKAFVFNKVSDAALLLLCIWIYYETNTLNIQTILVELPKINSKYLYWSSSDILSFLLILPVCIKSAQIFFHIWLPDSMEAPVPASALIHSATLVSAGVFLLLRFKDVVDMSHTARVIFSLVGALTALLGAVSSIFQTDTKKILAYSTISHCGFLVLSAVVCPVEYTILYLYIHGFFKAISFLCVGNVIRFNSGCQDIRTMGGYAKYMPFEAYALFISLLILAGLPFSLGFFMKHFVITSLSTLSFFKLTIYICIFFASISGLLYCSRLYYGIFFGVKKSYKTVYESASRLVGEADDTFYYTNSSLGSILSIFFLSTFALLICYLLLYMMYTSFEGCADISSVNTFKTNLSIFFKFTSGEEFNFSLLSTVIILIIVIISTFGIVYTFKHENVYYTVTYLFLFLFLFLLFWLIFSNVISIFCTISFF